MKTLPLLGALVIVIATETSLAQERKTRISLTPNSNVSAAEIGKVLDVLCPDIIITADPQRAGYLLEAIYTGAGPARNPYKFTLFNHDGGDWLTMEFVKAHCEQSL